MDKQPKKRKPIKVNIDTKNVDVKFDRDENGNVALDVDTKNVDIHATKTDDAITIDLDINDRDEYTFESNGNSKHLPKGIMKLTGEMVKIFVRKGFGKLIK